MLTWGQDMAADQSIDHINTDAVFVFVVVDAILLGPSDIQVLLPETVGVVLPTLGDFALSDVFVLLSPIPLLGHRHDGGISGVNDLSPTGFLGHL